MSAAHQSADFTTDETPSPLEPGTRETAFHRTEPSAGDGQEPLSARIERTNLRVQTRALERSLRESQRRQQALIDQYERVLEERDRESGRSREDTGFVSRLWDRLR